MKCDRRVGRQVSARCGTPAAPGDIDSRRAVLKRGRLATAVAITAWTAWCVCFPVTSSAQTVAPDSLSVQQAVQMAVSGHPAVTRARQALAAADEHVSTGRAPYYPEVSLSGAYGRIDPVSTVQVGKASLQIYPEDNYDVHLGLRQILYDFGRTTVSVDLARSGRDAAAVSLEQVKWNLAYRTISVFDAILILRSNLSVLDEQIMALNRHRDVARRQVQAGTSTEFDVLTTEVRIAAAQSERIDVANALESQEIQFRELTGLGSQEPVLLKGEFSSAALRLDPDSLLKEASRQRPELAAARAAENSASIQSHLSSLGMRPSLTANLTSGFKNGYYPDLNLLKANLFAGVQANVPLFDGRRTRGQTREAQAALLAAKAHTQDLEREVATEVEQAIAGAEASQRKIQSAELQVVQAQQAVSMAQARYQAGVATNLDVLDAQTALTQASLNRLRSLYNYTVGLAALDRATGKRVW